MSMPRSKAKKHPRMHGDCGFLPESATVGRFVVFGIILTEKPRHQQTNPDTENNGQDNARQRNIHPNLPRR